MTADELRRSLSSVPAPGASATPKPAPPPSGPYARNPLLNYKTGPDVGVNCPACHWVKAHLGFEYCPYHVAWRDMKVFAVDRVGDVLDNPKVWATTEPKYARGQRLWFQGKLPVKVEQRYWGGDGSWRYVAKTVHGSGAAVDGPEVLFTDEYAPGWSA